MTFFNQRLFVYTLNFTMITSGLLKQPARVMRKIHTQYNGYYTLENMKRRNGNVINHLLKPDILTAVMKDTSARCIAFRNYRDNNMIEL